VSADARERVSALENDLVDHSGAQQDRPARRRSSPDAQEIEAIIGSTQYAIACSAKPAWGWAAILAAVVDRVRRRRIGSLSR